MGIEIFSVSTAYLYGVSARLTHRTYDRLDVHIYSTSKTTAQPACRVRTNPMLRRIRNANVVTLRYETVETVLICLYLNRFNNLSISITSFSNKELPRLKPVVEPSGIEMARLLQSSSRTTQHNEVHNTFLMRGQNGH